MVALLPKHWSRMNYLNLFQMPTPMKITGRSSTITNAFVNSIIPVIYPTEEQVREALGILCMDQDSMCCSYCGATSTEWDHLRPIVNDKKPTGYISEIHNLVPACGKCNQSKGNTAWRQWMFSAAKLSPKSRQIIDIDARAERLKSYENWGIPVVVDFETIVGHDNWRQHWDNWKTIQVTMQDAHDLPIESIEWWQKSILGNNI